MRDQIHVCEDSEALALHARDWLVELIGRHPSEQTPFSIALSGGSTPKRLYQLLSELPAGTVDWNRVRLIWGDERNVPPSHAESNFRMVKENWLSHVPIPPENILAVPDPGGPPELAAENYERLLRERFGCPDQVPILDCVLLGMGDDVHTASLFPGTKALGERRRLVVANHVPKLDRWRITLTPPLINAARHVAFLISGVNKQSALSSLWHAPLDPEQFPSQLVRPAGGQLLFLVDQQALGDVPPPESSVVEVIGNWGSARNN